MHVHTESPRSPRWGPLPSGLHPGVQGFLAALKFDRPIEQAVVDRDNPFVVLGHLRCAAAELPVIEPEVNRFGYASGLALEVLEEGGKIHRIGDVWYHASSEKPSHEVRLRGYGDETTVIMDADSGHVVDRLDKFRALRIFYPGAIYFHRGDTYAMVHHDTERNVVRVRREEVSYYTDPVTGTSVDHVDVVLDQRPLGIAQACLGEVFAVLSTPLYERVRFYTLDRISQHPVDVPPVAYEAMSFYLTTPPELPKEVARLRLNPESGMKGIPVLCQPHPPAVPDQRRQQFRLVVRVQEHALAHDVLV